MSTLLSVYFWLIVMGAVVNVIWNIVGFLEMVFAPRLYRRKRPGLVWRLLGASDHPR